jgi:bifunctional N-acetylglucosamine-1-phosphate-uridyltransferase/glucosamine-1-phosphate-acetyltransferase GlmU-like protein
VERVLVIPAAGSGSRLGANMPKLLVPVNGRPMLEHLLDRYAEEAQRAILVVSPSAVEAVSATVAAAAIPVDLVVQERPTGMLDAILLAADAVKAANPVRVLITWCDQIAITPETVAAVVRAAAERPAPALVLPSCERIEPYVHLVREAGGRIVRVLHRREGDDMPVFGETDAGVFDLSAAAYQDWLPAYARNPEIGALTGERNFVPFVAFAAERGAVVTIPCREPEEAIGINTPGELALLEAHLRSRQPS